MECARCGAAVEPTVAECGYCGAPTPHAERILAEERAREDRAAAELAEAARREQAAGAQKMEQAATRALVFSLVGALFCFFPFLQVVSIVFYFRARAAARQLASDVPGKAVVGVAISAISLVLITAFLVFAFTMDTQNQERADTRIAALTAQVGPALARPDLDWATACALAEMHALKNGHGDERGKNFVHFDCKGKIAGTKEQPMLEHFSFASDIDDDRFDVTVCFERGARWYVTEMTQGRVCSVR